ncbi:hypothetical protein MHBO_003130 [Bonamia ostreae]|uniref:Uncharacterized protein n=1 Tax=Bonamia ostreae TaxID=126728 RepID=A0ABV2APJ7_9EUKA
MRKLEKMTKESVNPYEFATSEVICFLVDTLLAFSNEKVSDLTRKMITYIDQNTKFRTDSILDAIYNKLPEHLINLNHAHSVFEMLRCLIRSQHNINSYKFYLLSCCYIHLSVFYVLNLLFICIYLGDFCSIHLHTVTYTI